MNEAADGNIRVRFAPSPTGYLHIGGARTVLFNWLTARKHGGTFVLRIEDTDRTRHVEDSVKKILDDLTWLKLSWDEGPEVGGEFGPYFQSQRLDLYNQRIQQLLESGDAYYALETPGELETMRAAATAEKGALKYRRPDPLPTIAEGLAARGEGRSVAVRLKMPGTDITVVDDILGEVTLAADQLEDFIIQKADGYPTYHFACAVDDALMKITHVLRGQEHLMNTPKHIALQHALGFATPRYAHLPVIFNMEGSKMSKRDKERALKKGLQSPEIDVHDFRVAGYLPEAVLNFISLLGWSPGEDREQFDLDEMVSLFSIDRVGKTNAKFDREKLLSFNTDWATRVSPERLLEAFKDYLTVNAVDSAGAPSSPSVGDAPESAAPSSPRVGVAGAPSSPRVGDGTLGVRIPPALINAADATLAKTLEVCAGFRTFPDVIKKAGFIFEPDESIQYDPKAVKKVLAKNDGEGFAMLRDLLPKLTELTDWSSDSLEALFASICEEKNLKLGKVAQPVRVAVSGTTISPSIHETLVMLGKESTLFRLERCVKDH
ncbi:MAG: glutamate--tRNA ligase [Phycisphaerales bacterium]|nr:MAG: glutamate--tRNA ligase [Phycisphaerales bacterium]